MSESLVSNDPMQLARVTPLGGSANFRHMGGYPAADGRRTRATHLFRTGWPQLDEPDDARRFLDRGVCRVFDFRNAAERARQPHALPGMSESQVIGLPIEQGSMAGYLQSLSGGASSASDTVAAMTVMYREMVRDGAGQFARLLNAAAECDGPVMVACTLGKDRTGVASALLLKALGVSDDDIFDDYLVSATVYDPLAEQLYARMQLERLGAGLDVVRGILTVRPEYLSGAWEEMKEVSGSVEAFMRDRLGLSDLSRAKLRETYAG